MYSAFQLALKYSKYFFTASNAKGHGVHSPFVFEFITQVLNDKRHFYAYDKIEKIRSELLLDRRIITIEDLGAGSTVTKSNERRIKHIARSALKPKKFGQLMFRIVDFYHLNTMVELGTSLGVTSAYLAAGNAMGKIYTFEGAKQVANTAREIFSRLELKNLELIDGNFDDTLIPQLNKIETVDLVFVDGNHRKAPTLSYFKHCLTKAHEYSIFIFDDIHWSADMEEAWKYIQQHSLVTLTIDLFFIGIVFFRKEHKMPQHFTIRY